MYGVSLGNLTESGAAGLSSKSHQYGRYMVRREVSAFAVVRAVLEGLWSCNTRLAGVHSVAKIDLDVGKIVGTITSAKVPD